MTFFFDLGVNTVTSCPNSTSLHAYECATIPTPPPCGGNDNVTCAIFIVQIFIPVFQLEFPSFFLFSLLYIEVHNLRLNLQLN